MFKVKYMTAPLKIKKQFLASKVNLGSVAQIAVHSTDTKIIAEAWALIPLDLMRQ